uniref:Uncharacterized protein n=1 Tax=Meloidogyne floridensis TaxID=298350 RepID=A0A915NPB2_9BILA
MTESYDIDEDIFLNNDAMTQFYELRDFYVSVALLVKRYSKNKSLGKKLNSDAVNLCKELSVMVNEPNWNNLSKFLNNGKTILKKIYKIIPEVYSDYNDIVGVEALKVIFNNWGIFSIIFGLWHQKILSVSQPSVSQNYTHHRRTKRSNYKKNDDHEEEDVDQIRQGVDDAYNSIFLFATRIYPS